MTKEEKSKSQKTEQPTDLKKKKSREEGQIVISKELMNFFGLLGGFCIIAYSSQWITSDFLSYFYGSGFLDFRDCSEKAVMKVASLVLFSVAPVLLVVGFVQALLGLVKTGFLWSGRKLVPKASNLSFSLKRLFSMQVIWQFLSVILKLCVISVAVYYFMRGSLPDILFKCWGGTHQTADIIHQSAISVLLYSAVFIFFIGLMDYGYQWFAHWKKLHMTLQEVKDEMKDTERSAIVVRRQHSFMENLRHKRSLNRVKEAVVVVTNPTMYAVAIKWGNNMYAPVVVSKGVDRFGGRIRDVAKKFGIPVLARPSLARSLYNEIDVNKFVLKKHYQALVEVISYVMELKMDNKK